MLEQAIPIFFCVLFFGSLLIGGIKQPNKKYTPSTTSKYRQDHIIAMLKEAYEVNSPRKINAPRKKLDAEEMINVIVGAYLDDQIDSFELEEMTAQVTKGEVKIPLKWYGKYGQS